MSDANQLEQDLHYVREVVDRADRSPHRPVAIYSIWALYVLIGYPLVDFAPRYSGPFFSIGWLVCMVLTLYFVYRYKKSTGVKSGGHRSSLFWLGGSTLIILSLIGLSITNSNLRGEASGQLAVVLIGIFYYLGGVHYDRNFLWLGPVLCVGGILVGIVPHYGWTALGIVFALGLMGPTLFVPRPPEEIQTSAPAV
jgi:hypothetical protein